MFICSGADLLSERSYDATRNNWRYKLPISQYADRAPRPTCELDAREDREVGKRRRKLCCLRSKDCKRMDGQPSLERRGRPPESRNLEAGPILKGAYLPKL